MQEQNVEPNWDRYEGLESVYYDHLESQTDEQNRESLDRLTMAISNFLLMPYWELKKHRDQNES